jgi:DNA-directed RNA polymerase subunit RPC12/RpoP
MPVNKCPGMNPSFWKPKDVVEGKCSSCGSEMEFWKDDIKRACSKCGKVIFNPNLGNLCLTYCDKAVECLGNLDITEWKKQNEIDKKKNVEK